MNEQFQVEKILDATNLGGVQPPHEISRPRRQTAIGLITSDRMNKTRRVEVPKLEPHAKYRRYIERRTVCHVHDEANLTKNGDWVEIMETRPISKLKRWRIIRIVRAGVQPELGGEGEAATAVLRARLARLRAKDDREARDHLGWVTDHPPLNLVEDLRNAKERILPTKDEIKAWREQFNDRRLLLIDRKYKSGLNAAEVAELERLQSEAGFYLRRKLPAVDNAQ